MTQHQLGYLVWQKVAEAAREDTPVLIPMGTVEMQGLHSPMGHDYIVAERLALAVAEQEACLICPTVPFGYSHFSRPIPGTISLRAETLRNLLTDICESLLKHGFRHLIFINNHGLNEPILGHVADDIRERYQVSVASVFPSKIAQDIAQELGLFSGDSTVFAHGGEPTVSLMMYLTPDDMAMQGAQYRPYASPFPGFELAGPGAVKVKPTTVNVYMDMTKLAPTGGGGDANQASAEKGRQMFEGMAELVAGFIRQFREVRM
jgi:creatinine amidohydrolase